MAGELADKVAIVTGGASGIGRAAAELFVREGGRVIIADLDSIGGRALADALGASAAFHRTDVSEADQVQAVVDFAVAHFGGLDVMFNNAGIAGRPMDTIEHDNFGDFDQVMAVNLRGVMLGTQRAARYMVRNGGGSIVITASVAGSFAGFGQAAYRAAKAGVLQFARAAAIEYGAHAVRVNCINPLGIPSGMLGEEAVRMLMTGQALKRLASPVDVANVALFLASDRSAHVTGQDIAVDGGFSIGDNTNYVERMLEMRGQQEGMLDGKP